MPHFGPFLSFPADGWLSEHSFPARFLQISSPARTRTSGPGGNRIRLSMEGIPVGFLLLLAGLCVAALVAALVAYGLKQRRLQRLKSPRRDYRRRR